METWFEETVRWFGKNETVMAFPLAADFVTLLGGNASVSPVVPTWQVHCFSHGLGSRHILWLLV